MKRIINIIVVIAATVLTLSCGKEKETDILVGSYNIKGTETVQWGDEAPKKYEINDEFRIFMGNDGNLHTSGTFATICHRNGTKVTFEPFRQPGFEIDTIVDDTEFVDGKLTISLHEEGDIDSGTPVHYSHVLNAVATKKNY